MSSPPNPNSFVLIGTIGFCLYFIFLLLVLWRVYVTFGSNVGNIPVSFYKKAFHVSLCLSVTFEVLYYGIMWIEATVNLDSYSMHIVGQYLNSVAFLCVVLFWSESVSFGGQLDMLKYLAFIIISFNGLLLLTVLILFAVYGLLTSSKVSTGADAIMALDLAVTLIVFAAWMLVYGIRLQLRLTNIHRAKTFDFSAKMSELFRINAVISMCCACYFFRGLCLVTIFLMDSGDDDDALNLPTTELAWFATSLWGPMLISGCLLLYVMRMRRRRVHRDTSLEGNAGSNNVNTGVCNDADDEFDEDENFSTISEIIRRSTFIGVENPIKLNQSGAGIATAAAANPVRGSNSGHLSLQSSGYSRHPGTSRPPPVEQNAQERESSFIELRPGSSTNARYTGSSNDNWN